MCCRCFPSSSCQFRPSSARGRPCCGADKFVPVFRSDYTKQTFNENQIELATKTMVSEVTDKKIFAKNADKEVVEYPYGLLVWATGNTARAVTRDLMARIGSVQDSRRGLLVDDHLRVLGADGVFALGDCTATNYAPTAQCASQQGIYLSKVFGQLAKKQVLVDELDAAKRSGADPARLDALANAVIRASNVRPFHYSHQGSLAYIGSDKVSRLCINAPAFLTFCR